jgi:hypothetical protein
MTLINPFTALSRVFKEIETSVNPPDNQNKTNPIAPRLVIAI